MKPFALDPSTGRRSVSHGATPPRGRSIDLLAPAALASAALAVGVGLAGCNSGAGANSGNQGSGNAPGSIVDQPDPTIGSRHFVVDQNSGGHSTHPRLLSLKWGRLANVYDSTGTLQQKDMVVGPDIPAADPVHITLSINPVTDETIVPIGSVYGTPGYFDTFAELDRNLTPIVDKSLDPNELPPFSVAPRNSALILQFDDLLDATTIANETVKLLTGNPPLTPVDLRCIPDINHGDVADFTHLDSGSGQQVPGPDGILEFHTTRVILDTTVSEIEAQESNPPLPENALGLPPSATSNLPNVGIRVPTVQDASIGQLVILRNPAGHGISFTNSGPNDPNSLTEDVVRALRSGNNTDQNHGFLFDNIQPQIVGKQPVAVGTVTQGSNPGEYQTSVTFTVLPCKSKLKVGDVIEEPGVFGQVLVETADPDANGMIAEVHFKIVYPPTGAITPGVAQIASVFDQSDNFGQQACFLRFPGAATPPNLDVATSSSIILRFSEPMDPLTVKPFDSFLITRVSTTPAYNQLVVGAITASADLREFTFTPVLPFTHAASATETYYATVTSDATGPTDLAGNQVLSSGFLPQVNFRIAASESPQNTDGFALRFNSTDEVNNGTPNGPELRGQFLYDLTAGLLRPRAVLRFGAAATRDKPVVGAMRIPPAGVQTPLSPLGSKLQCIWRYCDVGMGLLDETFTNVDVEGLDWAPIGGNVVADSYTNFAIYLSHCFKLPDESVSNTTLLPLYPTSGLVSTYSQNVLNEPANNPQSNVHPKALGYTLNPADRFLSTTTPVVTMMPYPLNRTLPVSLHQFYTWRDTTLRSLGGPSNGGAEMPIVIRVGGSGTAGTPYSAGQIPTIGLPLLMEFRCYPDTEAHGTNSFDINIAINSSSAPTFRAFSTGGTNSSGQQVIRNPDLEQVASGGFNPTSNPPGAPTLPIDNTVYIGQMDLVVRVSRAHSIWFNGGSSSTVYSPPVIEPRPSDLPQGTQIVLAFRGATTVTGDPGVNADRLDPYGELISPPGTGTVTFFGGDSNWKTSLTVLNGAQYFQVRITFVSNVETDLVPNLSALGFAFRH